MTRRALPWVLGLVGLGGCDGEAMMGGGDSDAESEPRGCDTETRADDYALGLAKTGDAYTVTFVNALPAPPTRGDNTWTVKVTDSTGAGMTALAIDTVPFMPDHMHGTTVETRVTETTDGEYVLTPVNLFMPGLWEVTLDVTSPGATEDSVVFAFCVDP